MNGSMWSHYLGKGTKINMFFTIKTSSALLNAAKELKNKNNFTSATVIELDVKDGETPIEKLTKKVAELGANLFETVKLQGRITAPLFTYADASETPRVDGMLPGFYTFWDDFAHRNTVT